MAFLQVLVYRKKDLNGGVKCKINMSETGCPGILDDSLKPPCTVLWLRTYVYLLAAAADVLRRFLRGVSVVFFYNRMSERPCAEAS